MRRWVIVLVVLVAGCRRSAPRLETPAVLTDPAGPGLDVPACEADAHPLSAACRADGSGDLDGDGVADCWRVARAPGASAIWPGCAGAPIELDVLGEAITLPAAQRTRAWAIAIARALAGEDDAGCETPDVTCPSGPPVLQAWFAERRRAAERPSAWIAGHPLPLVWIAGAPATPPPAAAVLDPGANAGDVDESIRMASIAVRLAAPLQSIARCKHHELWLGGGVLAAQDLDAPRWTILGTSIRAARCVDDLVYFPTVSGVDTDGVTVVDLATSRSFATIAGSSWEPGADGSLDTFGYRRLTFAQLGGLIAASADDLPTCARPGDAPLLALAPPATCELAGRVELGKREVCWDATYYGTSAGGLQWHLRASAPCGGASDGFLQDLELDEVDLLLEWHHDAPPDDVALLLGELLTGSAATCVAPRPGCRRADPALRWLYDRFAGFGTVDEHGAAHGRSKPIWQDGAPTAPAPEAARIDDLPMHDTRFMGTLLLYTGHLGGPLTEQPSCERWKVWAGSAGGAVVDPRTGRWAWAYLASSGDVLQHAHVVQPVTRGWCEGELAMFALADGAVVTTDPAKGTWAIAPPP